MFEIFLEALIIVVFMYILLYMIIGKASGLFWEFVLKGILTILIMGFISFIFVYLFTGFQREKKDEKEKYF